MFYLLFSVRRYKKNLLDQFDYFIRSEDKAKERIV